MKGYSGGGIFTVMMVLGVGAGVTQLFGCHVCFRTTISIERKKLYYWIWVYMMALNGLLIAFVLANVVGLIYWLTASSAFKVYLLENIFCAFFQSQYGEKDRDGVATGEYFCPSNAMLGIRINCTKFANLVSLFSEKIIKIAAIRAHLLKLKCTKFDSG